MAKRIAGTMYVKVDGEQLEISGGFECPAMQVKREAVMSATGMAGFKETVNRQYVKMTSLFTPNFPLATLQSNTEMTVTVELANGKVYTLSGAYVEGDSVIKGDDGTIDLEFTGVKGIWQ